MSLKIIKNGTIVTAAETYSAEILINGEVIEAIGRDFERLHPEAEVIDAAGKYVFPRRNRSACAFGFVDARDGFKRRSLYWDEGGGVRRDDDGDRFCQS